MYTQTLRIAVDLDFSTGRRNGDGEFGIFDVFDNDIFNLIVSG